MEECAYEISFETGDDKYTCLTNMLRGLDVVGYTKP